MRVNRLVVLSGLLGLAGLLAEVANAEAMRFLLAGNGGNCAGCEWIAAEGEITAETPAAFADFVAAEDAGYAGMVVQFNGSGTDTQAAMALGELIREYRFVTSVGDTIANAILPEFHDVAPGVCREACAIAFLGGKGRYISDASQLSFEGFRAAEKSAVSAYFERLALDTSLYNFLAVMPPNESYQLEASDKHLGEMGIITPLTQTPTKWAMIDTPQGVMAASTLGTDADAVTVRFYCESGKAQLDYLVAINKFGEHLLQAETLREVYREVPPMIGYETTFVGVVDDSANGQMAITLALTNAAAIAFVQSSQLVAHYDEVAHAYLPYYEWFDFGQIPGDRQMLTTVLDHCR